MLHAGLDLSRKRLDFCPLDESGERIELGPIRQQRQKDRGVAARARSVWGRFKAAIVAAPRSVRRYRSFFEHVKGYRVIANDALLERGEDWTARLQQAANA
jgi:hypothetical protein